MEQNSSNDDCRESIKCIEILHLLLDNEATPEEEQYLREHIDSCLPCLKNYELEAEIRNLLRTRINKPHTPADLLVSIKSRVTVSMTSKG